MNRNQTACLSGILLLLIFAFSGCAKTAPIAEKPQLVKTTKINTGAATSCTYTGEVRGRYESQLAFQVSGKIISRNVELGSRVSAGETLLTIDTKDIAQTVNIGAAQVESARAQLELARTNEARFRKLYAEAAVSAAQYDQYKASYDAALAAYNQAQAQYAQSSNALGYAQLKADSDGVIAAVQAEVGQVVSAGQTIVTLVKSGEMEIEIFLPENKIKEITPGKTAAVHFWALSQLTLEGTVREIAPIADKGSRTYQTRIALANPPPEVQLGMTASVIFSGSSAADYPVIPLSAVYQTTGQPQVWLVKNDTVELQTISIDAFGENHVKVTAGLHPGDVIVTAGVHKLHEGQSVRQQEGDAQ